ncbi:Glycosyltransferase WbsX [Lachnospiraceae bacterium KH1T2]|nr:Glycosyltransferase WbsX [Lachnospiraceae bacterium KH1T2]
MDVSKIIALYLPQFHTIPENDEWWGKGFTEWTNVKKAKPVFENHFQPRIPLNDDYYDLDNPDVLPNQMELAPKYGIDGFCFYHYWFSGKKLLEKPLEALLERSKIPLPFMLCWANEPWTRRWDGCKGAKHILIDQNYGNEREWKKHFEYLVSFFERDEYIKLNEKPVIVIYDEEDIYDGREMIDFWNECAIKFGFNKGLHVYRMNRQKPQKNFKFYGDGVIDFEPFATLATINPYEKHKCERKKYVDENRDRIIDDGRVLDYGTFCSQMVSRYTFSDVNHCLGMFPGWDNSPRVGENFKVIFEGNNPGEFEKFFRIQFRRSIEKHNPFIFINAWNEWGEGAFLQPDERYKYGYLEAIKKVKMENGLSE